MNAQVISLEPKEVSISITDTDIGILYIIQDEIWRKIDVRGNQKEGIR